MAILGQFWTDEDSPDAVRAIEIEGWCDVLEGCTPVEVRHAWREYQTSGPRSRSGRLAKPDAGALLMLAQRARSASLRAALVDAPPTEVEPKRVIVTPEQARRIMAEVYGRDDGSTPIPDKRADTSDA